MKAKRAPVRKTTVVALTQKEQLKELENQLQSVEHLVADNEDRRRADRLVDLKSVAVLQKEIASIAHFLLGFRKDVSLLAFQQTTPQPQNQESPSIPIFSPPPCAPPSTIFPSTPAPVQHYLAPFTSAPASPATQYLPPPTSVTGQYYAAPVSPINPPPSPTLSPSPPDSPIPETGNIVNDKRLIPLPAGPQGPESSHRIDILVRLAAWPPPAFGQTANDKNLETVRFIMISVLHLKVGEGPGLIAMPVSAHRRPDDSEKSFRWWDFASALAFMRSLK